MKKIFAALILMTIASVSYAKAFVCTGYLNGAQVGEPMKVNAAKVLVAETKAYARMKKAGIKVDYVSCK